MEVELNISQDCGDNEGADLLCLGLNDDSLQTTGSLILDLELGDGSNPQVSFDSLGETLQAEEIIAIRGDLQLVHGLLRDIDGTPLIIDTGHVKLGSCVDLNLETEFEAQVDELVIGELFPNVLHELLLEDVDVRHIIC